MRCGWIAIVLLIVAGVDRPALAQLGIMEKPSFTAPGFSVVPPPQSATTVQLPTFQFFTVSTSVMVPDSGAGVVGGRRQRSLGTNHYSSPFFGPQRATGSAVGGSQVQVRAQIHDMTEYDRALLVQSGGGVSSNSPSPPAIRSTTSTSTADVPPVGSVADARRQREEELAKADRVALDHYQRGQQAEAEGRFSLAKAYYQMAIGKASASLKRDIERRMVLMKVGAAE